MSDENKKDTRDNDCWISIGFLDPKYYGHYLEKDLKHFRMRTNVSVAEAQEYCRWQGHQDSRKIIKNDPVYSKAEEEAEQLKANDKWSEAYYKEPCVSIYFTSHTDEKKNNEENPELLLKN